MPLKTPWGGVGTGVARKHIQQSGQCLTEALPALRYRMGDEVRSVRTINTTTANRTNGRHPLERCSGGLIMYTVGCSVAELEPAPLNSALAARMSTITMISPSTAHLRFLLSRERSNCCTTYLSLIVLFLTVSSAAYVNADNIAVSSERIR